jgi:hypothetical protein
MLPRQNEGGCDELDVDYGFQPTAQGHSCVAYLFFFVVFVVIYDIIYFPKSGV